MLIINVTMQLLNGAPVIGSLVCRRFVDVRTHFSLVHADCRLAGSCETKRLYSSASFAYVSERTPLPLARIRVDSRSICIVRASFSFKRTSLGVVGNYFRNCVSLFSRAVAQPADRAIWYIAHRIGGVSVTAEQAAHARTRLDRFSFAGALSRRCSMSTSSETAHGFSGFVVPHRHRRLWPLSARFGSFRFAFTTITTRLLILTWWRALLVGEAARCSVAFSAAPRQPAHTIPYAFSGPIQAFFIHAQLAAAFFSRCLAALAVPARLICFMYINV